MPLEYSVCHTAVQLHGGWYTCHIPWAARVRCGASCMYTFLLHWTRPLHPCVTMALAPLGRCWVDAPACYLVAWCGMLLHGIGALRTNGISRRVRSPGPIRSAKGTWRCSPPHCVNATGKASPAVDISFKAKQHSTAEAQPQASSVCRQQRHLLIGPRPRRLARLLVEPVSASAGPTICMVVHTPCVRACGRACLSRLCIGHAGLAAWASAPGRRRLLSCAFAARKERLLLPQWRCR